MDSIDSVIRVQNASVRFNLAKEKTDNIKEYFVKLIKRQLMFEEFYAVRDIDFTVKRGEAWALVGHNGCGKSTLLKLISGIIQPYKGSVEVNGMIAPIIELSAGMDPDMTAKENIFLNGAFLGYTEQLLNEKYEEIVDFAEIEEFIDVPVKNFSSGMLARLGFSIATVVRPDILIIDEVLSVGDMHFQKKSLQRIQELLAQDTTLLFVSHALPTVREVCDKALWLDHGRMVAAGDVNTICDAYAETEN